VRFEQHILIARVRNGHVAEWTNDHAPVLLDDSKPSTYLGMIHETQTNYPLVICYIAIEHGIFIVDLPNLKMVIFHSYVSLPEGKI
jgi:hypothetical protein